jgi:hypothetical protein
MIKIYGIFLSVQKLNNLELKNSLLKYSYDEI